jgi:hypothetical protein
MSYYVPHSTPLPTSPRARRTVIVSGFPVPHRRPILIVFTPGILQQNFATRQVIDRLQRVEAFDP